MELSALTAALGRRGDGPLLLRPRHRWAGAGLLYFEEEPGRRAAGKLLTPDEPRRIATNIDKLPELSGVCRARHARPISSSSDASACRQTPSDPSIPALFCCRLAGRFCWCRLELNHLYANRIAVAWKDTREARRALSDSLPFLHDAEKVFLVEVCTEHEAKAVQHRMSNIMNYLARHHITTATALMLQAANVTDELLGVVRKEDVDLLVAGAYGHSRLGEWVFGGVTHDLLHKSPVCCLFSHW